MPDREDNCRQLTRARRCPQFIDQQIIRIAGNHPLAGVVLSGVPLVRVMTQAVAGCSNSRDHGTAGRGIASQEVGADKVEISPRVSGPDYFHG